MKIYVKILASRRTLCLRVGEYVRVDSVKRRVLDRLRALESGGIWRLYHAPSSNGKLEPLEDTKTLHHYQLHEGGTLYLGMKIAVTVDVIGGQSGVLVALDTADSIEDVKKMLQNKIGVHPDEQRLILGGKLVQDAGKVRDYELKNDDALVVIRRKRQYNLEIIDNQSRGEPIAKLQVRADFTVKHVKEMIAELTATPANIQSLSFRQQKLRDDKTLQHYSISPGSKIRLTVHEQIFVKTLTGNTLAFDVGERDSVEAVKSLIEEREGIPIRQQKLFFNGRRLQQHGTLKELGVSNGSTLELSLSLPGGGPVDIRISTFGGVTFTVQVQSDSTILELKQKIQQLKGYPVDQQKLIFCGKVLEDTPTVADYNIQRASTLHLLVSQPVGEKTVNVKVTTHIGKELSCSVTLCDTVETLTQIIEEKEGVPKKCQRLFCKGILVEHTISLKDIINGGQSHTKLEVCMYLEIRGEMDVFVGILSHTGKTSATPRFEKKIIVSVDKQMKVATLKRIIQHREKIPTYFQTLLHNGVVMEDHCLLAQWEQAMIEEKSMLHLRIEYPHHNQQLTVAVKTPGNSLDLPNLGLFVTIHGEIGCRSLVDSGNGGSNIEWHSLFHRNTLLENDKTLYDCRITDGSELQLVPANEFPVFINASVDGKPDRFFVTAKKTDTVREVKDKINCVSDLPTTHRLYLSGMELKDAKTMEECRVSAGYTLSSVPQGDIPISIRTRFTTVTFSFDPLNSVETIMEKIASTPEICVEQLNQRLLLHNVLLSDKVNRGRPIMECGISAGNTLNLVAIPQEIDIHVCTPRGSTLTLVCLRDCTIRDVKTAIEERADIPVENQILPFESDDKTLRDYGVVPGTHLDLVDFSVAQLKQAMCERALMQQELESTQRDRCVLKQKLKSVHKEKQLLQQKLEAEQKEESFNKMMLDSASNYMQSKITKYEGDLAQSKERNSELERKNQEIRERLAKEKCKTARQEKKSKSLKKKLLRHSSKVRRGSSPSIVCDIEDIEEDQNSILLTSTDRLKGEEEGAEKSIQGVVRSVSLQSQDVPTEYGFQDEFVYEGEEHVWSCEDHGIRISFPRHTHKKDIHVALMSLNNCSEEIDIHGDKDAEFVSAVYRVQLSSPLPAPVTVEIQHCIHIAHPDVASSLTFVQTNSGEECFTPIEGGQFDVDSSYGKIQLSHFCRFGIAKLFSRNRDIMYVTSLFARSNEGPLTHYMDVVVTRDLEDHLNQLKSGKYNKESGWIANDQFSVKINGTITVKCDSGQDLAKWKITDLRKKAKITQRLVDAYRPGRCIPCLPIKATWESRQPPKTTKNLSMTLSGAVDPVGEEVNFIFECVPYIYTKHKEVILGKLTCMRFVDEYGQERELRVKDELGAGWRDLASQLEFTVARIGAFSHSHTPVNDMISTWLQTDERRSWRRFIEKLSDAGLRPLATDLRYALMHIVYT